MTEVEYRFPEAGLVGTAIAFTTDTFDRYIDQALRNQGDADAALLRRNVLTPDAGVIEQVHKQFADLPSCIASGLLEVAGCHRETATMEDTLDGDTPPGVLRFAGLAPEDAARLKAVCPDAPLKLVTVCNDNREAIFACVLRTPGDTPLRLIREARSAKKGFGKACRSAAADVIEWSSAPPAEAFERYPAIPALVLAPIIIAMGDRGADARFRRR